MLNVAGHSVSIILAVGLGCGVGFIAGMYGIGGGFLLTPLMVVAFHLPITITVGTGLCFVVGTSVVSLLRHRDLGQGEIRFDLLMIPGSFAGVLAGARAVAWLEAHGRLSINGRSISAVRLMVEGLYVFFLLLVGFFLARSREEEPLARPRPPDGPLARWHLPLRIAFPAVRLEQTSVLPVVYIGMLMGFLSALLGIGGGVSLMPILLFGYRFPIRQAAGTGILVLFLTAALSVFEHARLGHVDLRLAMILLVGATFTAQLGALATHRLSPRLLAQIHAVVVLGAVAAVVWDLGTRLA